MNSNRHVSPAATETIMARGRPARNPHTRPAINTLERLHMELGGQILENRQRYDELSHQMRHVEAVIKMLDAACNLARITVKRRQPNKWFKRGTLYRRAVDVLRTATGRPARWRLKGVPTQAARLAPRAAASNFLRRSSKC